eukprot:CAMPEP_0194354580 /NCGR_PEP_ID=MMETSP0174-20130528/2704_1 /TAXON_ID=216777 /ORGANISM="Proboscia alata, Strain PI-D3" /LENGTH=331 /DNA_ID=CAMNT_0039123581 /DNA_START=28 /DNA_END=1023 /DNA_ORIENTATION=+
MAIIFGRPKYPSSPEGGSSYSITLPVERMRLIAYFFFVTLVGFASILFNTLVLPSIEAGAPDGTPTEEMGCGPFNRDVDHSIMKEFGLHFGDGFNLATSHLTELFGFTNVCVLWDYTPAREIVAMYFPLFEYSLAGYVMLDLIYITLSHKRGEIPDWYYSLVKIVSPFTILLIAWFRMIFVMIAYTDPEEHSLAFLGMQIALFSVVIMNSLFVILSGQSYPSIGLTKGTTTKLAYAYLICNVVVSSIKMGATLYIVQNTYSPDWYKFPFPMFGWCRGEALDRVWMFFNAVLPIFISYVRMSNEKPMTITFSVPTPTYEGNQKTSETTGLVN